jgi:hypothetical protein
VRKHFGATNDTEESDGTGGADVTMVVVSRPFLFGRPRHLKRARVAHLGAIADTTSQVDLRLRIGGDTKAARTVSIPATNFDQAKRKRTMVSGVGDAPQIEATTTARVRFSMIGVSAEVLKEPVG